MKGFLSGIVLIILIGVGGLVYRNAVEHPSRPIACPLDSKSCPDGSLVARSGPACEFGACLPPNVSLTDARILFALPESFVPAELPDATSIAAYEASTASSTGSSRIVVRRYAITASSTALAAIQETAIDGTGQPVPATSFSSSVIGARRFAIVSIGRFGGAVHTAYYLARGTDVLRFDAIDTGVSNWSDSELDTASLPAHAALVKLLTAMQML